MPSATFTAYLVIKAPLDSRYMPIIESMDDMINELCSLSREIPIPIDGFSTVYPSIDRLSAPFQESKEVEAWMKTADLDLCQIITISTDVFFQSDEMTATEVSTTGEQTISFPTTQWIKSIFHKRVFDLIIVANIARVGSIDLHRGAIFQDGKLVEQMKSINPSTLSEAFLYAMSKQWPPLHSLAFIDVWKWAVKQQGFLEGFGGGRVSRAMNALTHVFGSDTFLGTDALFWAIMGIEAIYTNGEESITKQIRDKVWLFLGQQESFKKDITAMYRVRSKFIHGASDVSGRMVLYDYDPELVKGILDSYDAERLAMAILVATLQELIRRGWDSINFSYIASEASND